MMTSLRKAIYVVDPLIIALLGVSVLAIRPVAISEEVTRVKLKELNREAVGHANVNVPTIVLDTGNCDASILFDGDPVDVDALAQRFETTAPGEVVIRTDSITAALISRLKGSGVERVGLTFTENLAPAPAQGGN